MSDRFDFEDFSIGIVCGLFLGAVAGVLLAPASGKETRKNISGWTEDTKASVGELIDQANNLIEAASGKAEQYLGLKEKGIKKKLEEIRTELERYDLSGS
jgi:gas vesicle protein